MLIQQPGMSDRRRRALVRFDSSTLKRSEQILIRDRWTTQTNQRTNFLLEESIYTIEKTTETNS